MDLTWTGVPVSRIRMGVRNRPRALQKELRSFFKRCAATNTTIGSITCARACIWWWWWYISRRRIKNIHPKNSVAFQSIGKVKRPVGYMQGCTNLRRSSQYGTKKSRRKKLLRTDGMKEQFRLPIVINNDKRATCNPVHLKRVICR